MKALDLLLTRSSFSKLVEPAPAGEHLQQIIQAGLRAPDHAHLSPYEIIICEGDGLTKLRNIFVTAAKQANFSPEKVEKAQKMTYRAPMIAITIMRYKSHPKVPRVEQIGTTACLTQNMQMAAQALGYNGIWRTGSYATDHNVREALGLSEYDEIVGFLYLGTPETDVPIKRDRDASQFVSYWRESE